MLVNIGNILSLLARTLREEILGCLAEINEKVDKLTNSNTGEFEEEEEEFEVKLDSDRELRSFEHRLETNEAGLKSKLLLIDFITKIQKFSCI